MVVCCYFCFGFGGVCVQEGRSTRFSPLCRTPRPQHETPQRARWLVTHVAAVAYATATVPLLLAALLLLAPLMCAPEEGGGSARRSGTAAATSAAEGVTEPLLGDAAAGAEAPPPQAEVTTV